MSVQTTIYDVFLSYSLTEADEARLIQRALTEAGFDVFNPAEAGPEGGEAATDALWQALAESAALVVLLHPQREPSAAVLVELGAAMAWDKPVYVVQIGPGTAKPPTYLASYPLYPLSRIDDVAGAVKRSLRTLDDEDRAVLCDVYLDLGVPTDQLLRNPSSLDRLADEFNRRANENLPGERLVQELIRLRKTGGLPRLPKKSPRNGSRKS